MYAYASSRVITELNITPKHDGISYGLAEAINKWHTMRAKDYQPSLGSYLAWVQPKIFLSPSQKPNY